jgi:hypothetical protein
MQFLSLCVSVCESVCVVRDCEREAHLGSRRWDGQRQVSINDHLRDRLSITPQNGQPSILGTAIECSLCWQPNCNLGKSERSHWLKQAVLVTYLLDTRLVVDGCSAHHNHCFSIWMYQYLLI